MMPSRRVIILAGAPPPSSLDAASCTIGDFTYPFTQYLELGKHGHVGSTAAPQPGSSRAVAAWRSLPLKRTAHGPGAGFMFSQAHALGMDGDDADAAASWSRPHFFTTADVSFEDATVATCGGTEVDALTQFCEQSLAEHDAAPASSGISQSFDTSLATDTSFATNSTAGVSEAAPRPPPVPVAAHLSDLEDIPPAPQVLAFAPQTITINLIVGVLSIAQPRTVQTRWGTTLSLVEVLVGDETSSGFGVTFWLSSDNAVASDVGRLRRQDVVLMRNVALRVFRGKVYGQSLRGGRTKLSLLWRRDGSGHYSSRDLHRSKTGGIPQSEKTRQVKDWLLKFVGAWPGDNTKFGAKSWDRPPADTQ
ncbi:hypothetical protein HJFPF1_08979 [Paramyrothecium foliicola]|nr:hypothetical protein HJFPF1_08979 [Paramyrothecium foliicola]